MSFSKFFLKKARDKILGQLLKSLSNLTNSELESKSNTHTLTDQTDDGEKENSIRRQN